MGFLPMHHHHRFPPATPHALPSLPAGCVHDSLHLRQPGHMQHCPSTAPLSVCSWSPVHCVNPPSISPLPLLLLYHPIPPSPPHSIHTRSGPITMATTVSPLQIHILSFTLPLKNFCPFLAALGNKKEAGRGRTPHFRASLSLSLSHTPHTHTHRSSRSDTPLPWHAPGLPARRWWPA